MTKLKAISATALLAMGGMREKSGEGEGVNLEMSISRVLFNFNFIRENKRNVEQMFKQGLNAFKFIQHRYNKFQHGFKEVANGFGIALQHVEAVCSDLMRKYFLSQYAGSSHKCLIMWRGFDS